MAKTNNKGKKPAGKKSGGKTPAGKGGITGLQIGLIVVAVLIVSGGVAAGVIRGMNKGDSTIAGSGVKLPDYVFSSTAPRGTPEAYQFAVDNQDVLKYIPCYCGCGELDGHDSNLDCFIRSGSGKDIVFDKHAVG